MEKKATQAPSAEAEGADLGGQLRSAVGRLYRRFRSERPEGGLGDAALDVLTRLHKRGPQTLTELSEHDRVSPASMSQTVNRLTSAGYAVRTGDPDVALADDDALPSALYDAIARGKLIQAIKIYRETTGVGLKEAKDAVDAMAGKTRR